MDGDEMIEWFRMVMNWMTFDGENAGNPPCLGIYSAFE